MTNFRIDWIVSGGFFFIITYNILSCLESFYVVWMALRHIKEYIVSAKTRQNWKMEFGKSEYAPRSFQSI